MGYVTRQYLADAYTPSDDLLITNDKEQSTGSTDYIQVKEIKIIKSLYPLSTFRFKFDLKAGDIAPSYGKVYRNGVAVGTEQSNNTDAYVTKSEDIAVTNWAMNDTIELWIKAFGGHTTYTRNFRLYGVASPFADTLGA